MTTSPSTLADLKQALAEAPFAADQSEMSCAPTPIARLQGGALFPGVLGFEETIEPELVNALLARHDFILLGTRGQAKAIDYCVASDVPRRDDLAVAGSERTTIHGADLEVRSRATRPNWAMRTTPGPRAEQQASRGTLPRLTSTSPMIKTSTRSKPLKGTCSATNWPMHWRSAAARQSRHLRHQRIARSLRQDPGRPLQHHAGRRRPDHGCIERVAARRTAGLHVANLTTTNTRGKIITPLKDRIGSEIRTHYPRTVELGVEVTAQRMGAIAACISRSDPDDISWRRRNRWRSITTRRGKADKVWRSQACSISLLEIASTAEASTRAKDRRRLRVADVYAGLPAIKWARSSCSTKENSGEDTVARERSAAPPYYLRRSRPAADVEEIVAWFDHGGALKIGVEEKGEIFRASAWIPGYWVWPMSEACAWPRTTTSRSPRTTGVEAPRRRAADQPQ